MAQLKESKAQDSNVSNTAVVGAGQSQFFFLNPAYGWGRLEITEKAMSMLLSQLGIFSRFFKYLSAFGIKTFAEDEGFGGFDHSITLSPDRDPKTLESCYLLKYVDLKDSPGSSKNPWSIRQALIYQKSIFESAQDTFLFIRLPQVLSEQFGRLLNKNRKDLSTPHWTQVQLLCLRSVAHNWRQYINWLDEQVSILFDRVILASVELDKLNDFDSVSSSLRDMKRIQYLIDQCLRVSHMLELNMDVVENMQRASESAESLERSERAEVFRTFMDGLCTVLADHKVLRKSIRSLSSRATVLSGQLRDTVSLRNSEINKGIGSLTNRVSSATVALSTKASQEAQVVKVLTVVALIFVPASFAADFLQMGYINVAPDDPGFNVTAEKALWFYAILAIPMILLTLAVYFACEMANKRTARKRNDWDLDFDLGAGLEKA
ncbi:MAG: hypothetical protein M1818_002237 [Claussenomyces sp. TS43310]|nr:MAG: hypothetical protein M1818_002237 [Claussenomyces sp. TS43310]